MIRKSPLTARLLWPLPVWFHTAMARITGGWRIVGLKKGAELKSLRWECWP